MAETHAPLGGLVAGKRQLAETAGEYREAFRMRPSMARTRPDLASVLAAEALKRLGQLVVNAVLTIALDGFADFGMRQGEKFVDVALERRTIRPVPPVPISGVDRPGNLPYYVLDVAVEIDIVCGGIGMRRVSGS